MCIVQCVMCVKRTIILLWMPGRFHNNLIQRCCVQVLIKTYAFRSVFSACNLQMKWAVRLVRCVRRASKRKCRQKECSKQNYDVKFYSCANRFTRNNTVLLNIKTQSAHFTIISRSCRVVPRLRWESSFYTEDFHKYFNLCFHRKNEEWWYKYI